MKHFTFSNGVKNNSYNKIKIDMKKKHKGGNRKISAFIVYMYRFISVFCRLRKHFLLFCPAVCNCRVWDQR